MAGIKRRLALIGVGLAGTTAAGLGGVAVAHAASPTAQARTTAVTATPSPSSSAGTRNCPDMGNSSSG